MGTFSNWRLCVCVTGRDCSQLGLETAHPGAAAAALRWSCWHLQHKLREGSEGGKCLLALGPHPWCYLQGGLLL